MTNAGTKTLINSVVVCAFIALAALAYVIAGRFDAPAGEAEIALLTDSQRALVSSAFAIPALLIAWLLKSRTTGLIAASAVGLVTAVGVVLQCRLDTVSILWSQPLVWEVAGTFSLWRLLAHTIPKLFDSSTAHFLVCGWAGFRTAYSIGVGSHELPPTFHDEYAYLFQAQTFLAGRVAWPADATTPAFEQVHVLTHDVFASRYFPGTAIWMMPFVAAGLPMAAMWTAQGLTAGFMSIAARRIHKNAGWLTGLLVACAPGQILFGNALLSVAPTMAAFAGFLWLWFLTIEKKTPAAAVGAGLMIGLAFLTRPLTAVGLGFPFAAYTLYRMIRNTPPGFRLRAKLMIAAFALAPIGMSAYNIIVLGTFADSPYSKYTREVTPSHVYGFYNRDRGKLHQSEKVFAPYDQWAENLTPATTHLTLRKRLLSAFLVGTGIPIVMAILLVISLLTMPKLGDRTLLPWLACLGLAIAYTPYWFEGLFGFGYFAEALPTLLMLAAVAAVFVDGRISAPVFSVSLAFHAIGALAILPPLQFDSKSDMIFPRMQAQQIREDERRFAQANGPIIVFVVVDPKNPLHSTLVFNDPTFTSDVIRAWNKPEFVDRVRKRFPERAAFVMEYFGFNRPIRWKKL